MIVIIISFFLVSLIILRIPKWFWSSSEKKESLDLIDILLFLFLAVSFLLLIPINFVIWTKVFSFLDLIANETTLLLTNLY